MSTTGDAGRLPSIATTNISLRAIVDADKRLDELSTARVIGEAAKPQALAYRKDMTVLDVMIQVGGLTDFADGNAARIFRVSEGGKLYSVRLRDLVKRGDITANADIRPGDR